MQIAGEREKPVGQLYEIVGIRQSSLSQHLSKLRALGLVYAHGDAQTSYHRLVICGTQQALDVHHKLDCILVRRGCKLIFGARIVGERLLRC